MAVLQIKKHTLFILGICFFIIGKAQYVTIPDYNFANWLQNNGFAQCMTGNQLDTTCPAVINASSLNPTSQSITDITGIEYFRNLHQLSVQDNSLTFLPALPQGITDLIVSGNPLTYVSAFPPGLTYFTCERITGNVASFPPLPGSLEEFVCSFSPSITSLPILPDSVIFLYANDCNITNISTLPASLQTLEVDNNISLRFQLSSLPANLKELDCSFDDGINLPPLPSSLEVLNIAFSLIDSLPTLPDSLKGLVCSGNNISSLPTLPSTLQTLYCDNNQLTQLPALPPSLVDLRCGYNLLTQLPPLPGSLGILDCSYNQLTQLPPLPGSLGILDCNNNQLIQLPALPNSLLFFDCSETLISSIPDLPDTLSLLNCAYNPNLSCLPELKRINDLYFDSFHISCLPNYGIVHNSTPALANVPLCGIFNANGCNNYWDISGKVFYDNDTNCIFDTNDVGQDYVKVQLYSNGSLLQQVFTGREGYYSFQVPYGNYDLQVDTTGFPFIIGCPDTGHISINISPLDSLSFSNNFGLKCRTQGFDLGVHSILNSVVISAVPGHTVPIYVSAGDIAQLYGAHCAAGIGGQVQLTVSGSAVYAGMQAGALTPTTVSGNTLTWNIQDFGAVDDNTAFNTLFTIDTNAVTGSQICINVSVTPVIGDYNPANNTLNYCFTIHSSYDPNEKEVYPVGAVDTSQWLTYTVRFQNTGTAPAEHVYILDTLSNNLDVSTFQLLAYSHYNLTQVLGNVAKFNFPNINLPDSSADEPNSHGFVQYKIKPKQNLPPGANHVFNTAYIYFDFNIPVVTNTTDNVICVQYDSVITRYICYGDSVDFYGTYYNTGVHSDTFARQSGCDSIITLVLNLIPNNISINQSICFGDTFWVAGYAHTLTGYYSDTLQNMNGCDSIIHLNLLVYDSVPVSAFNTSFCFGDTFWVAGYAHTLTGYYSDTLQNINGCDSIVNLNLLVYDSVPATVFNASICSGDTFWIAGYYAYTIPGHFSNTVQNINGCDSIITLNLVVYPPANAVVNATICQGDTFRVGNYMHFTTGVYNDTIQNVNGCDSIVQLNLLVNPPPNIYMRCNFGDTTTLCNSCGWLYTDYANATSLEWHIKNASQPVSFDTVFTAGASVMIYLDSPCIPQLVTKIQVPQTELQVCVSANNQCSNPSVCDTVMLLTTGIIEPNPDDIILFPNPAQLYTTVKLTNAALGAWLKVTDPTGRLIQEQKITALQFNLSTASLASGVYFISIVNNKGLSVVKRLVVQ